MLILLNKVSAASSMVATFTHYDNGISPPFEVSTLHEVGHCLAQQIASGCDSSLLGAIIGTLEAFTINSTSGSIKAMTINMVLAGVIFGGSAKGVDLVQAVPLGSIQPINSMEQVQSAGAGIKSKVDTPFMQVANAVQTSELLGITGGGCLVSWSSLQGKWTVGQWQWMGKGCVQVWAC